MHIYRSLVQYFKTLKERIFNTNKLNNAVKEIYYLELKVAQLQNLNHNLEKQLKLIYDEGLEKLVNNPNTKVVGLSIRQIKELKRQYRTFTGKDSEDL